MRNNLDELTHPGPTPNGFAEESSDHEGTEEVTQVDSPLAQDGQDGHAPHESEEEDLPGIPPVHYS